MSRLWPDTHPDVDRLRVGWLRHMPAWHKMALSWPKQLSPEGVSA